MKGSHGKVPQFTSLSLAVFFLFLLLVFESSLASVRSRQRPEPCNRLVVYLHDIIYDGKNAGNATSVIVGAPAWSNLTKLDEQHARFGDVVVFDDPITMDNNLHSPPVGRARGLYLYDGNGTFTAWLSFTFAFNSTEHKGTIIFAGDDPILEKTRNISVIGGTGDFFLARGVATVQTDAIETDAYFRLRVDVRIYDCYRN